MENLIINEEDNTLENILNKEEISHLLLLKRVEKK